MANQPISAVDLRGLWGVGVIGGGTAEAGIPGAGVSVSAGVGGFWGGPQGGNSPSGCKSTPLVVGGFAGGGAGPFLTNANSASQLGGPFDTWSINVGIGPI